MAKFYIQLQGKLVPVGKITEEDIKEALGVEQVFNFSGDFYELDNNPFKDESNGELKIVDPEGRIIAIVNEDGIHSIEMTAEDESGTVHKLTDKMDKADFDEIISMDGNNFIIQDEDGNQGFVLTAEGATAHDFITYKGDSLLDVADRVESIETNVGSINDMISTAGNEFIIQDEDGNKGFVLNGEGAKAYDFITSENDSLLDVADRVESIESNVGSLNDIISDSNDSEFIIIGKDDKVGLKLNSEGLHVQDVTAYGNGQHVLSEKANMQYVETVKFELENKIEDEINKLDNTVTTSGSTHGVKVSVTQTNGKLSSVSVDDSKIDFTKLTSNPIDVNEESQSFVIKDGSGNYGFVLNDEGATAKDFTTSTGVSLNGLNTTVVSIRTEVDNINNMISADEEGALIIKDDSGNVGLKLDKDGLQVQDVTAGIHTLSSKANKEYVEEVDRRLADIEGLLEEDNDGIIDNLKDVINFFASVRESDKGAALLSTVATHTAQISDNASDISTNASNITTLNSTVASHKKELDGKITTLSNLVNTNKNEIDNTIASLTTTVSGSGSTHGVTVKVEQNKGLITKVSVNDSTIDFYRLASNPIENKEDDKFVITDDSGRYGLKLDSTGLHVRDVIAHGDNVNGIHTLSSKADRDYVDGSISDVNAEITTLAGTVSALSTRVSTTEKNITSLSGRVSANEGDITTLNSTVGTHTTTITTLNSTVASHKKELDDDIDTLSGRVGVNETSISNLSGTVASLSTRVSATEKNISSLDGRVSTTETSIGSLNSTVASLSTRVSATEKNISSLDGRVSTTEVSIGNLSGTAASLSTRVSATEKNINSLSDTVESINNITSASATINSNVGTPTVTVSYTGETSNKKLNFEFKNLKGDKGDTGTSVSVSTVTSSSDDGGTNTVTFTDGNKLYVKNGSKGSTGAGISKISKKGTNNLVDTYEITYTDGRTATSFTVTNGAPGTNVTITSVSQNTTAGSYSTVSFSTGDKLNIYNGQNGAKGSDGYSTYYTANSYASDHKIISQGVVTKPSERTIQIGDFILASNGNMFRVTGAGSNLSVDYITSIKGEQGPKGDDGTSVNIKGTLKETSDLASKKPTANGDGYLIDGYLYVYTGSGQTYGFENVGEIKGPQGETGPQGPEGPAGASVTIKSLVSSSAPGEASTITFSDNKILKVYNGADGAQGPAGVGISKISKSGETVTITYTDTTTSSFTVNDGVDGTSVTITSVSQNNNAGESSTVTFSDGKSLSIKNGQNGQNGKDGKDGTSVTITSVSQNNNAGESSKVTFSDGKSLSIKNGQNGVDGTSVTITSVSQNNTAGESSKVTFSDGKSLSIKNGQNGKDGKDGADGTSVNIKGNVPTEDDLKTISEMVAGDGYIVDETGHLHVYTSDKKWIDAGEIKGPKGDSITITPKPIDGGYRFIINNVSEGDGSVSGGVFTGEIFYEDILDAPITMDDSGVLDITDDAGYIIAKIDSDGITTTKVKAKNGFYQTSDETLKVFHDSIEVDFNALKSIPKAYYTWKDEDVMQIGTSAQKVQELYPEIVSLDEKTGKLTLDYAKLSVIALKAIDLLHEENENLKLELKSLHNEMDKIKSHLGL